MSVVSVIYVLGQPIGNYIKHMWIVSHSNIISIWTYTCILKYNLSFLAYCMKLAYICMNWQACINDQNPLLGNMPPMHIKDPSTPCKQVELHDFYNYSIIVAIVVTKAKTHSAPC